MPRPVLVTFDYRCPFARNAHESIVAGLRAGRDWAIDFRPFSLDQAHVEDDQLPVWKRAPKERGSGVLALEWGIAVRDAFPERFLDFHVEAFAARHDRGLRFPDPGVMEGAAERAGLDPAAVAAEVAAGWPLEKLASEHTELADRWGVWGVPTFVDPELEESSEAVFIRFMERGRPDDVDRALALLDWVGLNEFKRTRIPR